MVFSLIKNWFLIFYCATKNLLTKQSEQRKKKTQNFKRICSRYSLNKVFLLKTQLKYKFSISICSNKVASSFLYIFAVWQTVTNL